VHRGVHCGNPGATHEAGTVHHQHDKHSRLSAVPRYCRLRDHKGRHRKYAVIEPAELKNLRIGGKKTIEISRFAIAAQIDPVLYEKPYFVVPNAGPQATAFAAVRQNILKAAFGGGRYRLQRAAAPDEAGSPSRSKPAAHDSLIRSVSERKFVIPVSTRITLRL
jgi:hypothetical protein